jgi:hypothetical protein
MKTLIRQTRYGRPTGRKFVMALAVVSLISGLSIAPAFAERDNGHGRADQRGGHGQRASRGDRDRHGYDHQRGGRPYGYSYAQPVYVPPTVYAEPQQSPGISLFLPLDFRR